MTTTPKDVETLLAKAELVAGMGPSGAPWYEPEAGALVPSLAKVITEQQREIDALRQACTISGTERDQFRRLLHVNEPLLEDLVNLVSRAGVQLDAMREATGTRQATHERDTLPPVSAEIERSA